MLGRDGLRLHSRLCRRPPLIGALVISLYRSMHVSKSLCQANPPEQPSCEMASALARCDRACRPRESVLHGAQPPIEWPVSVALSTVGRPGTLPALLSSESKDHPRRGRSSAIDLRRTPSQRPELWVGQRLLRLPRSTSKAKASSLGSQKRRKRASHKSTSAIGAGSIE